MLKYLSAPHPEPASKTFHPGFVCSDAVTDWSSPLILPSQIHTLFGEKSLAIAISSLSLSLSLSPV